MKPSFEWNNGRFEWEIVLRKPYWFFFLLQIPNIIRIFIGTTKHSKRQGLKWNESSDIGLKFRLLETNFKLFFLHSDLRQKIYKEAEKLSRKNRRNIRS